MTKTKPEITASTALREIHKILDGVEWSPDTLDEIARVVIRAGYEIHDSNEVDERYEYIHSGQARVDGDYDAACKRAATEQGLNPVFDELRANDIAAELEQTGGMCMVAYVYAGDRDTAVGITRSPSDICRIHQADDPACGEFDECPESVYLVCFYGPYLRGSTAEDLGSVVTDRASLDHLAQIVHELLVDGPSRASRPGDTVPGS